MMNLRYMGEFLSRASIVWRVEILQYGWYDDEVGSLTFEADEALTIHYPDTSKDEVICGSTATLQIESPGDRTYEDLYTIVPGKIRMDVYRNDALYWSGTLDPEFYEEPYEKASKYVVNLTFSDFGILDRIKYAMAGMRTLSDILVMSLNEAGINYGGIDQSMISTSLILNGRAMTLADVKVRSDNFFDEDGEASTLKEVIEGVFRPLGLRMVQRCGTVYVYDLNGLYEKGSTSAVEWNGDAQTMGVDVVYNNAKITWSTYAQSGNLAPTECWTEPTDVNLINLNNVYPETYGNCQYYSYFYQNDPIGWRDATDSGFTLYLTTQGKNVTLRTDNYPAIRFFKIVPQYDGDESEGVALVWPSVNWYKNYYSPGNYHTEILQHLHAVREDLFGTMLTVQKSLFRSTSVWVPPVDNSTDLLLRITFSMMLDVRFNPYEDASNFDGAPTQKTYAEKWAKYGNYLYVPVTIKFKPTGSSDIWCWDNRDVVGQAVSNGVSTINQTLGKWVRYDNTRDDYPAQWGYLCWYDKNDRVDSSGVCKGWAKNRPAINPHKGQLTSILKNAEDGQFIPYPNAGAGGDLWIEVRSTGWMVSNENAALKTEAGWPINTGDLIGTIRWLLMKLPEIEIVNNLQFKNTISTDDVEYNAEINANAKEAIEIDTICGTKVGGVPTARGAYFSVATGKQITEMSRAGRMAQVEELLIGTLYSQYANRKTKLSGEMELKADGLVTYTEQNQEEKLFMMAGETQDLIADTTEATIIELHPDTYRKLN